MPALRNVKFYTCCDEPYLDITFNITMRRKVSREKNLSRGQKEFFLGQ